MRENYYKSYYQQNADRRKEYSREYYHKNKDKIKAYRAANADKLKADTKAYRQKNAVIIKKRKLSPKGRYQSYKSGAKTREIDFQLSFESFQLLTSAPCYYCGGLSKDSDYTGIDRVVNTRGYEIDNCVSCCDLCNYMKNDMSSGEFLLKIEQIHNRRFA